MRKRAGLARALALDPEILFLDEPTAGLDPIGAAAFDQLIRDLQQSLGLTVFMVTHDLDTPVRDLRPHRRAGRQARSRSARWRNCCRTTIPGSTNISTARARAPRPSQRQRKRWKPAPATSLVGAFVLVLMVAAAVFVIWIGSSRARRSSPGTTS